MAVETTATSASFTGTGVSSTYAPGFYVNSSDQVVVTVNGVLQTLGDDYVVNNVGASTGCDIVGTFTVGSAIYIERVTPITQLVDTQNNETILEDVLDAEFDKLTMIAQEIGGKADRAILVPKGEQGGTLPAAASRAGRYIAFDINGVPVAAEGAGADTALRSDLASGAATRGANIVAFDPRSTDTANSVARALRVKLYFSAWPGVDPTGAADNGVLLQAFMNFCKTINAIPYLGRGTFLINTTVVVTDWAGASLIGEGIVASVINRTVTGEAIRFTNCQRGTVSDIAFNGAAVAGNAGVVIDGAGVGVMSLLRNQFASFGGRGAYVNGTVANQMSSCFFRDNLFLSCGVTDTVPQFEARYVNDSFFECNQYGALDLGGPYPPTGAYHYSCQAGNWANNYHWECLVGARYEFCSYARWVGNRWETNQREGAVFNSCAFFAIGNCHWHTKAQQTNNTYDSIRFESCGTFVIDNCQAYNFVGVAVLPKYSVTFDAACSTGRVSNCSFNDYGTAPVNDLTAYGQIEFRGCAPNGLAVSDTGFRTWLFHSGSVAGGSTTFIAPSGSRGAAEAAGLFIPGFSGRARRLRVYADVPPGGAQTITVMLRSNIADTALTLTMTGATQAAVVDVPVSFGPADLMSLRVVKSATAATGNVIAAVTADK